MLILCVKKEIGVSFEHAKGDMKSSAATHTSLSMRSSCKCGGVCGTREESVSNCVPLRLMMIRLNPLHGHAAMWHAPQSRRLAAGRARHHGRERVSNGMHLARCGGAGAVGVSTWSSSAAFHPISRRWRLRCNQSRSKPSARRQSRLVRNPAPRCGGKTPPEPTRVQVKKGRGSHHSSRPLTFPASWLARSDKES